MSIEYYRRYIDNALLITRGELFGVANVNNLLEKIFRMFLLQVLKRIFPILVPPLNDSKVLYDFTARA
jgi:hypothetical protein